MKEIFLLSDTASAKTFVLPSVLHMHLIPSASITPSHTPPPNYTFFSTSASQPPLQGVQLSSIIQENVTYTDTQPLSSIHTCRAVALSLAQANTHGGALLVYITKLENNEITSRDLFPLQSLLSSLRAHSSIQTFHLALVTVCNDLRSGDGRILPTLDSRTVRALGLGDVRFHEAFLFPRQADEADRARLRAFLLQENEGQESRERIYSSGVHKNRPQALGPSLYSQDVLQRRPGTQVDQEFLEPFANAEMRNREEQSAHEGVDTMDRQGGNGSHDSTMQAFEMELSQAEMDTELARLRRRNNDACNIS